MCGVRRSAPDKRLRVLVGLEKAKSVDLIPCLSLNGKLKDPWNATWLTEVATIDGGPLISSDQPQVRACGSLLAAPCAIDYPLGLAREVA